MKPKLLALELWAVGDLIISSPFLRQAAEQFDVTVLAKPFALELQPRISPDLKVIPFRAPWTAFTFGEKYRVSAWPWRSLRDLLLQLRQARFDIAVSARWDPRDHLLLKLSGARRRLGFARLGSHLLLSEALTPPDPAAHRYESWRTIGTALGLDLPARDTIQLAPLQTGSVIVVHSGAAQPTRVWPLDRYLGIVRRLRAQGFSVRVICNPEGRDWWLRSGETGVATPTTLTALLNLMDGAGALIGNDSGPGHLAASRGIPTFTIFGPQVPEWFVPLHPAAAWVEGKPCPYKPCFDYCRFPAPHCLLNVTEDEVWAKLQPFLREHFIASAVPLATT